MNYKLQEYLTDDKYEYRRAIIFVLSFVFLYITVSALFFDNEEAICMFKKVSKNSDYLGFLVQFGVITMVSGLFSIILFSFRSAIASSFVGFLIFLLSFEISHNGLFFAIFLVSISLIFFNAIIRIHPKLLLIAIVLCIFGYLMKDVSKPIGLAKERTNYEMYKNLSTAEWCCSTKSNSDGLCGVEYYCWTYIGKYDDALKYFQATRESIIKQKREMKNHKDFFIDPINTDENKGYGTNIGISLVPREEAIKEGDLDGARHAKRVSEGRID